MGFNELRVFNLDLLAKMSARVIDEPNALWVKLLKGLYYAKGDFSGCDKRR